GHRTAVSGMNLIGMNLIGIVCNALALMPLSLRPTDASDASDMLMSETGIWLPGICETGTPKPPAGGGLTPSCPKKYAREQPLRESVPTRRLPIELSVTSLSTKATSPLGAATRSATLRMCASLGARCWSPAGCHIASGLGAVFRV